MEKQIKEFLEELPFWANLSENEKALTGSRSVIKHFEKDQLINSSDSSCMGIVFVLKGEVRVSLISDEGREITLYRVGVNDCCVTTASCVIQQITFDTVVTAAKETEMLVIPSPVCAKLKDSNVYVRAFMFETETKRFSQTIWVMQQLLFKRFDQRLAEYLISEYEKTGSSEIKITQEEIARNVNSAREVVTRMLKQFEGDGLVELKRGRIMLKDVDGLKDLL